MKNKCIYFEYTQGGIHLKIAMLGWGTVARSLMEQIEKRHDPELQVAAILIWKPHPLSHPAMTYDYAQVLADPQIDVVVEMISGASAAWDYCRQAMEAGKSVVTSNKAMVSAYYRELVNLAKKHQVQFRYDASVAGGIPWLRTITALKATDPILAIEGIFNGTTNYILDHMERDGLSLSEGIAQAQRLGYAEADPRADLEGEDLARKLMISAGCAFNVLLHRDQFSAQGLQGLTCQDIQAFEAKGKRCRLLSILKKTEAGIQARIEPVLLPVTAPLAQIRDNLNAGLLRTASLGELTLIGQGAGGPPTAHAVLTDILEIKKKSQVSPLPLHEVKISEAAEDVRYYVGTNDQTAELFNGVTAEIRRSEGRVQLWTQSGNSRDLQALIIQARTFDPQLFAARIQEEEI